MLSKLLSSFFGQNQSPVSDFPTDPFDLDYPICAWAEYDPFTVRDGVQGVQIFGATGSGKTSGSGQFLAESFLRAGYGGLILTVKTDERKTWQDYCQRNGRELVIFSADSKWRFNFLDYEMTRGGRGAGQTENLVNIFMSVLEIQSPKSKGQVAGFWKNAVKQLLRNSIDLLKFAEEEISVKKIYEVVNSAPQDLKDLQPTIKEGKKYPTEWMKKSFCSACLQKVKKRQDLSATQQEDSKIVFDYWTKQYTALDPKTRSNILFTFTGFADVFIRDTLRELFCTNTNIYPEMIPKGAVILLDLPIHEYGEVGRFAQIIFKYIFQKSIERRQDKDGRPVFLWADEAQYFINSHDAIFQSTARSSKTMTVYLTQNLGGYSENLGEDLIGSLLGNLQTKIFHQNTDPKTNKYATDLIGEVYRTESSTTTGRRFYEDDEDRGSNTYSEKLAPQVLPVELSELATGGASNNYMVTGLIFQAGKKFNQTGKNWLVAGFEQV